MWTRARSKARDTMNGTDIPAVEEDLGWDNPNVPAAIGVSVGAGLATAVGGAMVFFPDFIRRVPQSTILGASLALSAGVMLYVSFIEIFAKSLAEIETEFPPDTKPGQANAITTVCFFAGMLVCVLLELIVHKLASKTALGHDIVCATHAPVEGFGPVQAQGHSHADGHCGSHPWLSRSVLDFSTSSVTSAGVRPEGPAGPRGLFHLDQAAETRAGCEGERTDQSGGQLARSRGCSSRHGTCVCLRTCMHACAPRMLRVR